MNRSQVTALVLCLLLLAAWTACAGPTVDSVSLRSESAELDMNELTEAIKAKYLNCPGMSIDGALRNQFEEVTLGDVKVVNDHSTGLMWQQAQTDARYDWRELEAYVAQVNESNEAGFSDWRVPTVEELASLVSDDQTGSHYVASPLETAGVLGTWTIDVEKGAVGGAWFVSFVEGKVMGGNRLAGLGHARLVRSR